MKILYKTSYLTEVFLEFYALPHCIPFFFSSISQIQNVWSVTDGFHRNPHWQSPIISSCTGSIYIFTAFLNKTLAKYSPTLTQHHPPLAPMEVCTQKFPIMWYFSVLLPPTYCHPMYTTTNWGEQVVALYCTILFMWWHKDELWMDRLKINHLKKTNYACLQHKNQTGVISVFLHSITLYNMYCCNFYLLLSNYFNPAVLIHKVSVTKCQSAASFGIVVLKLPYICNGINQRYSSHLNIWRERVSSLKKGMVHQIQQKNIPF